MSPFTTEVANFTWTCTQQQITLLPTSTEGLSIPPALLFTKDQTQEIMIVVTTTESKRRKLIEGVNSGGNMDRGPMMFTSDVSLPKDNKKAMRGKQITAGQLTGLKTHRNANYATKERKRFKSMAVCQGK